MTLCSRSRFEDHPCRSRCRCCCSRASDAPTPLDLVLPQRLRPQFLHFPRAAGDPPLAERRARLRGPAQRARAGQDWWVRNIHNPSITVFLPPKEKATGAAVVICARGRLSRAGVQRRGQQPAEFLNSIGVAAFALKYRLPSEAGSPYTHGARPRGCLPRHPAGAQPRPRVGHRPGPRRHDGVLGGRRARLDGRLTPRVTGDPKAADPIDRLERPPRLQILIYPGRQGIPEAIPADAPPAFLLVANDDDYGCDRTTLEPLPEAARRRRRRRGALLRPGQARLQHGRPVEAECRSRPGPSAWPTGSTTAAT